MKTKLALGLGIGAIAVGSLAAYQFIAKPKAENQVETLLANMKAEVEARGDGSELSYGDVTIEGISAVIPNIHYVDGKSNMTSDIELATISATPGQIRSAELTNWTTTVTDAEYTFESTADSATVENLKFPEAVTGALLLGDITFGKVATKNVNFKFLKDDITINASFDASEMRDKTADLIASNSMTNLVVTVEPIDLKFETPEFTAQNSHLPAELNLMATPEEMFALYPKFFSEDAKMTSTLQYQGEEVGNFSYNISNMNAGEMGFPVSGDSEVSISATASRTQILDWLTLAAESSENSEGFDPAEVAAVLDQLGIEQYNIALSGSGSMKENGELSANITYDLGELGKLVMVADITNYDAEKVNAILGDPTKEPSEADIMAAFSEIGIQKADITYTDGVLADFLLGLNPKLPRAQMAMMSQLMLPSILKTEPTLAPQLTEAVVNFINGAEGFEIHAAPSAPVKVIDLISSVQQGGEVGTMLNLTVNGQ